MLVVLGYNYKRGRKDKFGDYRNTKLYGQRFPFRRKVTCTQEFIEQAGLNDESIRNAVISAIDTDHGLKLEIRGDSSPPKVVVNEDPKVESAPEETFFEKIDKIDAVLDDANFKVESEE
jgi:hypothetical protein